MSKFSVNLASYLLFFFCILILIFFIVRVSEHSISNNLYSGTLFTIVGNSHPQSGINDSILSQKLNVKVLNRSLDGQSMFWSIVGARKLIKQGADIVVIDITNNTYTSGWKTSDKLRGMREVDKKFFLTIKNWFYILEQDPIFTLKYFSNLNWPTSEINGGYSPNYSTFSNDLVIENKVDGLKSFKPDFDDTTVHDLIIEHDQIKFIIIRVPQHPNYYKLRGEKDEVFYMKRLDAFRRYPNTIVLDFGHIYSDDHYFADLEHLNYQGSIVFSHYLSDTLLRMN